MEELLARFLQYMDSLNSGSVHTRAAYQRDIREFISFLQEEGIEELQEDVYKRQGMICSLPVSCAAWRAMSKVRPADFWLE